MRKILFCVLVSASFFNCNHPAKDALTIDHEITIHEGKSELYGMCFMKVLKDDIFVCNAVSKKILHFKVNNDNAVLKDSFSYGTIWKLALKDYYGNDTAKIRINSKLMPQMNVVSDMN